MFYLNVDGQREGILLKIVYIYISSFMEGKL